MSTIASNFNFPTSKQIPSESIMDINGKQAYLGNQYALPVAGFSITGSSETPVVQIANPASNGKSLFLSFCSISAISYLAQFKFYLGPSSSAGTAITPVNRRPANGNTSNSVCVTGPTVVTKGTLFMSIECPTADIVTMENNLFLILDPGQTLLVTGTCGGTTVVNMNIGFYEI